jgi:hypothetical protein
VTSYTLLNEQVRGWICAGRTCCEQLCAGECTESHLLEQAWLGHAGGSLFAECMRSATQQRSGAWLVASCFPFSQDLNAMLAPVEWTLW